MQKSSKLELFYQIVKIHEFVKYVRRLRACMEPVVLDTRPRPKSKNVEITNPKT